MRISISGHALAGRHGRDLVCAGVSCIVTGAFNALDELSPNSCEFTIGENEMTVQTGSADDMTQQLLKMLMIQLETVQAGYPANLKITWKEV